MNDKLDTPSLETKRFRPYSEYKDSGVEWLGKIPAHWEVIRNLGIFADRREKGHPELPIYSVTQNDGVIPQDEVETKIVRPSENREGYKRIRVGDLVYNKMRMWQGAVGTSPATAIVSPAYVVCLPRRDLITRYFEYLYRTPIFIMESGRFSYGICDDMNSLRYEDFKGIYSIFPPLAEQRAIAVFLDRETAKIDSLIEKKERLIELLQEKRTALITQAVTKGLDPTVQMKNSRMEWLGGIPAHWDNTFLDKLIDPLRRITYGIVQPGEPDPEGIPMVRGQNYSRGWSPLDEIFRVSPAIEAPYRRARLKPGDIVMTIVGAGTGNVAIVPDWLEEANITQTTARIALNMQRGNNRYFAYQLQSIVGTVSVELTMKGAAQPGLNLGHIAKYRVVVPPVAEQKRISDYLDREIATVYALVTKVHEAIERLIEYRAALISAAVTGKIDAREA